VAAGVTHGKRGVLLLAQVSGLAVLAGRADLAASGARPLEPRDLTDTLFYIVFGIIVGFAADFVARGNRETANNQGAAQQLAAAQAAGRPAVPYDRLAIIVHDLKNPLTSIKAYAQLLQRRAAQGSAREYELTAMEALSTIESEANTMHRLIEEVLETPRSSSATAVTVRPEQVDLVELTERLVKQSRTMAAGREFRMQTAPPGTLVGCWDPMRLEQVIGNLLSNAVKYSPAGSTIAVTVAPELHGDTRWAGLSVRDQGMGIPATELPRIFDPYYRARNVQTGIPGTGLGLASARQIVELLGGTIGVESTQGSGTRFTVKLPLL
jgi:signal transduction histidine kinase